MNGRNAPLSPISVGGNDWSGYSPPTDKDGPYPNGRGQLASPPASATSIGAMNGGFPPGPRSAGGPSPPPSIGRSSAGTNIYARSESGRSMRDDAGEVILGEHYVVLKRFLGATSQNGAAAPNKARDKLQRLTAVQFLELSTDVYDELNRRYPPPNSEPPPKYLLPRDNFHPKRNQARQKLSSLPPPRFRDLATDVFTELERRIPRVIGNDIPRMNSPASIRMSSRSQTPSNGMGGFPPRAQSRVRRPSEASSVRSAAMSNGYGGPLSPGLPNNFERPQAKQSQSNTIVPNKSTMVEEDDDDSPVSILGSPTSGGPYGLNGQSMDRGANGETNSSLSDADRRLLDDYEVQVRELKEKLEVLQGDLRRKDDELDSIREGERSRASAANVDKKEWDDARVDLENQLSEAQSLNDRLKDELDRIRDDHDADTLRLRDEIQDLRQSAGNGRGGGSDAELQRENEDLRKSLREQEDVTEEVRREAQNLLREMRTLSQQSAAAWQKQTELETTIEKLEQESRDWRNRYTRAKTQLRNLRATSMGLTFDQDAAKYVQDRGFTTDNGLVKDIHVTKFQMSIDELLRRARVDEAEKVMEPMKAVVVSVRRIIKDMETSASTGSSEEQRQQQSRLKGRVSSTANNLITAAKNFAAAAGISPVALVDAAASHLVAAVVELLRNVKIRPTPTGELEDDDDGTVTPSGDSVAFFSPRSRGQTPLTSTISPEDTLPPPPGFRGFGNRLSADSSAYSPINSPRESGDRYGGPVGGAGNGLGIGAGNVNGGGYPASPINNLAPAPDSYGVNGYGSNGYGAPVPRDSRNEDLKIYLEDQTAVLIQDIQELVAAIRGDQAIEKLRDGISRIAEVVDKIVDETERSGNGGTMLQRLQACRERLLEAGDRGQELADQNLGPPGREWRMWTQTLPPIAFEIARESKELVQQVDRLVMSNGADDFS